MSNQNIEKLLQQIQSERRGGKPRADWVSRNRDILLMQVRNTDTGAKPRLRDAVSHFFGIFMPAEAAFVTVRTFGIFLLLTATLLGGGLASAQMYRDSLPGEMLYGVKVAVERVQLTLSPNAEYRLRMHAELADRRMEEVSRLAESGFASTGLVEDTLVSFEKDMLALREGLDEMSGIDPAAASETAKMIERKMTLYHNVLRKVATELPAESRVAVNATRNRIDDTAIRAMAVIVQRHLNGDETTPRAVVISNFDDRIKQAERSLDSVIADNQIYEEKSSAVRAKTAIAQVKILIEEENYEAALDKIAEVAQLTKEAEDEAVVEGEAEEGAEAGEGSAEATPAM